MKDLDNELPQPRLVTRGEEMLDILRPVEWGDVSPDVTNLNAATTDATCSDTTEAGYIVERHMGHRGQVTFVFTETIPETVSPLELPIDSGNRTYSAKSAQDTARFLLDNQ